MDINNVSIDLGGPALPARGPEDEQGNALFSVAPANANNESGNGYDKGAQLLSGATEVDLARVKQAMQADGRGSEKIIAVWRVSEENKNVVGALLRVRVELGEVVVEEVEVEEDTAADWRVFYHYRMELELELEELTIFMHADSKRPFVSLPIGVITAVISMCLMSQKALWRRGVAESTIYALGEKNFLRVHYEFSPPRGFVCAGNDCAGFPSVATNLRTGAQPLNAITNVRVDGKGGSGVSERESFSCHSLFGLPGKDDRLSGVRLSCPPGSNLPMVALASLDLRKWVATLGSNFPCISRGQQQTTAKQGLENTFFVLCSDAATACKLIQDAWEVAKERDGVPPPPVNPFAGSAGLNSVAAMVGAAQIGVGARQGVVPPPQPGFGRLGPRDPLYQQLQMSMLGVQGQPQAQSPATTLAGAGAQGGEGEGKSTVEKLKELSDLYAMGLISQSEYEAKKQEIMAKF
eukprot:g19331.t1